MKKILAVFILGALACGCGEKCRNDTVLVVPSPSGKHKAVVFHRQCGTDTGPNTQVSVISSYSDLSNIPGNALILEGDTPVQVQWTSESALRIGGLGASRAHKRQEEVAGITITYGP